MSSNLRTIVRLFWILPVLAALWTAWTFYSRHVQDQRLRQEALEKKRQKDQFAVEMMGGDRFEILHFYAMPGVLRKGESAQLCYSVSNAKTVKIDPPVGRVWPSLNRCLDVTPVADTTYTLTIEDEKGNTQKANLKLRVREGL